MKFFNLFARKSKVKVKKGQQTPPETAVSSSEFVSREEEAFSTTSLETYRYDSPDASLLRLSSYDPDVSQALWSLMSSVNSGWSFIVRKPTGEFDEIGYKKLVKIINDWNYYYQQTGWDYYLSIDSVINTLVKYSFVRGVISSELVLDASRLPERFVIIDPVRVEFMQPKPGVFVPYIEDKENNKIVSMDFPTFFYEPILLNAEDPYGVSPILSVLETIFFSLDVVRDLNRIMKVTGYPKISAKILMDQMLKNVPPRIRNDEAQLQQYITARFNEVVQTIRGTKPEEALVHFDMVEFDILESNSTGKAFDIRHIIQILDQKISAGLKTLPTILGRMTEKSGKDDVEAMLYTKMVKLYQRHVATFLSKVFTLILRLNGSASFVEFKFNLISLRSDQEVENHLKMKQSRLIEAVKLGWLTDVEASYELYGKPPVQESGLFGRYEELMIMERNGGQDVGQDPNVAGGTPVNTGEGRSSQDRRVTNEDIVNRGQEPTVGREADG